MTTIPMVEVDGEPRLWLYPKEVAPRVGVCEATVTSWCRDGLMPGARKVGRSWRIPASAFTSEALS